METDEIENTPSGFSMKNGLARMKKSILKTFHREKFVISDPKHTDKKDDVNYKRNRLKVELIIFCILCLVLIVALVTWFAVSHDKAKKDSLPTSYQYYTKGGILSGLEGIEKGFFLNSKPIVIFSGAIHYFRIHPEYWRQSLRKARAAGLNTIETYVPWNLHEPLKDVWDFGDKDYSMSPFLNIERFLRIAQEEDLFVIIRPGPYICAEWEFGGLPSYLLRDDMMLVRSSYVSFVDRVSEYLNHLLPLLVKYQFTRGGPIIAFQVENEYGSFGEGNIYFPDTQYLEFILNSMKNASITELFFTSDSYLKGSNGTLNGVFKGVNFQDDAAKEIGALLKVQPNLPVFVTEYWSGWFDHWTELHHITLPQDFESTVNYILNIGGSINFYMFQGGTNFGFLNGANVKNKTIYQPTVTSYDYDAPLTESGNYKSKYYILKNLIELYNPVKLRNPDIPELAAAVNYGSVEMMEYLNIESLLSQISNDFITPATRILTMENLPIHNNSGQSFGIIAYCVDDLTVNPGSVLRIDRQVYDLAFVTVDGVLMSPPIETSDDVQNGFGSWILRDHELKLNVSVESESSTVCIFVENLGRVNFGPPNILNSQRKGLLHETEVTLDGMVIDKWNIYALEFQRNWIQSLTHWIPLSVTQSLRGPNLLFGTFFIPDTPRDTYLVMGAPWIKGFVFINGFNIGRYFAVGPQKSLYVPGPLLRRGENVIMVFEIFNSGNEVKFSDTPDFGFKFTDKSS